jgi:hypothetical protein
MEKSFLSTHHSSIHSSIMVYLWLLVHSHPKIILDLDRVNLGLVCWFFFKYFFPKENNLRRKIESNSKYSGFLFCGLSFWLGLTLPQYHWFFLVAKFHTSRTTTKRIECQWYKGFFCQGKKKLQSHYWSRFLALANTTSLRGYLLVFFFGG